MAMIKAQFLFLS